MSAKQKALALVLAELDETKVKGTINGIIETKNGRVAEGDAETEELVNNIRNAIESDEDREAERDRDKNES